MTTPTRAAENMGEATPDAAGATPRVDLARWLKGNTHWVWLLIPFILACWMPILWSWDWWGNPRNPMLLQPFVPFLALALAWDRRADIVAAAQRSQDGMKRSFWVRGNPIPLIIGCLGLLFSHIIHVKGIAIFSLWLIAVGAIYQMYGMLVLKAAWVPIAFSFLVVPWPDGLLVSLMGRTLRGVSTVTRTLLELITTCSVDGRGFLRLNSWGYSVEFRESMAPVVYLFPALTLGLWYVLFRRMTWKPAVTFLATISVLSVVISVLLAVLVAVVTRFNKPLADLIQHYHPIMPGDFTQLAGWQQFAAMMLVAWGSLFMAFGLTELFLRSTFETERLARPTGVVVNKLGRGVQLIFSPLFFLIDGIGNLGKVFRRMERGTEGTLSKVFKKKKRDHW